MANLRSNSIGTQEWLLATEALEITALDYGATVLTAAINEQPNVKIYVGYPSQEMVDLLPLQYEIL